MFDAARGFQKVALRLQVENLSAVLRQRFAAVAQVQIRAAEPCVTSQESKCCHHPQT
jgi:hypothetical protein